MAEGCQGVGGAGGRRGWGLGWAVLRGGEEREIGWNRIWWDVRKYRHCGGEQAVHRSKGAGGIPVPGSVWELTGEIPEHPSPNSMLSLLWAGGWVKDLLGSLLT